MLPQAGNEGNDDVVRWSRWGRKAKSIRFRVPRNSVETAELNGWYSGTEKLEIAVSRPGPGGLVTPFQKVIAAGQFSRSYVLGDARILMQTQARICRTATTTFAWSFATKLNPQRYRMDYGVCESRTRLVPEDRYTSGLSMTRISRRFSSPAQAWPIRIRLAHQALPRKLLPWPPTQRASSGPTSMVMNGRRTWRMQQDFGLQQ